MLKPKYKQLYFLLCSLFCIVSSLAYSANQDSSKELDSIKKAISSKKNKITSVSQQTKKLEKQLRKDDVAIAKTAKALNETNQTLSKIRNKVKELTKEKVTLTQQKTRQETLLAKQLQAAYTSGNHDYLKLLLNQEDPSKVQRAITYYQYLNKARIKEIDDFQVTITELLNVVTELEAKTLQLNSLKTQQVVQQNNLKTSNQERAKTVAKLKRELSSSKQQLAKLIEAEENLLIEIQRLAKLAKKSVKLNGLSKLKGKLKWPIAGRIRHSFGSRKQGYLKWKGVLLTASAGKQVNSIHHGKVLFSDWLKGYGLITVIDHGNGYMSLYGYNQALLKSVGDTVEAGEPIALVGQSGGQNQPALYFEIRHNGQAVNPKTWCRK